MANKFWPMILGRWILPGGDYLFGQDMMKRFHYLEEAQWWDRERIYAERDQALAKLVQVAYKEVPFYTDLMDQACVKPQDIKTHFDLQRLPIVTKEMFRQHYPHATVRATGQKQYEVRTSGSTGTNFCVMEDRRTAGWHRSSFLLALHWAGWKLGEPHLQTGMTLQRSLDRKLKDVFMRCHYVSAYDLRDVNLDRNLDRIKHHNLYHVWGYPGSLYFLARRALQRGFSQKFRSIVTWGDMLYPHYRETIEKAFGVRVHDTYGCAEGIQIAAQCGYGTAYHIHALDAVVEFVDDNGQPVAVGQPGNLIITRLHAGPMPLIRYRIGDVGMSCGETICECGREFDLLQSIQGRETDAVLTPHGNRLIVHFFTGILEHFPEVDSFQVVQETIDSMLIRIVPSTKFTKDLETRIVRSLQEKGAMGIRIDIKTVDEIPISPTGKRRFVISHVSKSDQSLNVV